MRMAGPSLLLLILAVVGVLALVGLVTFLIGRRSRVRSVSTPCCARCYYPVEGLTSLSCPECGSDLRRVGILTPAMRRPVGPWLAITLWTLILPIPALVISGLLASLVLPQQSAYQDTWILTSAQTIGLDHLELRAAAETIRWPQSLPKVAGGPPDVIDLSLFRTSVSSSPDDLLTINLVDGVWHTSSDPSPKPLAELDAATFQTWIASSPEIDADAEPFIQVAFNLIRPLNGQPAGRQAFAALVQAATVPGVSNIRQQGSMSSIGPVPGALFAFVAFWVIVWLAGCLLFYRRQTAPH